MALAWCFPDEKTREGDGLLEAFTHWAAGYHLFVRYYEEPTLGRLFGEPYARYREAVPRWLPRRPVRTGSST